MAALQGVRPAGSFSLKNHEHDAATTLQVRSQRDTELDELFGSDSDGDEGGEKKAARRRRPEEGGSQKRSKRKAEEGALLVAKRELSVVPRCQAHTPEQSDGPADSSA